MRPTFNCTRIPSGTKGGRSSAKTTNTTTVGDWYLLYHLSCYIQCCRAVERREEREWTHCKSSFCLLCPDLFLYSFLVCVGVLDWKIRFDESENVGVRMLRGITDRIGGMFSEFICSLVVIFLTFFIVLPIHIVWCDDMPVYLINSVVSQYCILRQIVG